MTRNFEFGFGITGRQDNSNINMQFQKQDSNFLLHADFCIVDNAELRARARGGLLKERCGGGPTSFGLLTEPQKFQI